VVLRIFSSKIALKQCSESLSFPQVLSASFRFESLLVPVRARTPPFWVVLLLPSRSLLSVCLSLRPAYRTLVLDCKEIFLSKIGGDTVLIQLSVFFVLSAMCRIGIDSLQVRNIVLFLSRLNGLESNLDQYSPLRVLWY